MKVIYRTWSLYVLALLLSGANASGAEKPGSGRLWAVSDNSQLLAAIRAVQQEAGTIQLAPGTYSLSETVVIGDASRINIMGSGWNTVLEKLGSGDLLVLSNVSLSTIRNIRLQAGGRATTGTGIVFQGNSSSDLVDYVRVEGFSECGIEFQGSREKQMSSHTVRDCHFLNNRKYQLHLLFSNDFFISGNQFGCHGGKRPLAGTYLENASAGTYDRNYHWDNEVAFRMEKSRYNRIENNRFEESSQSNMILGSPNDTEKCIYTIIIGNTIHSNSKGNSGKYSAVVAWNCEYTTFCLNQIFTWGKDQARHCLEVNDGCANWIIKDNVLRSNQEKPALKYSPSAGHIVKDNME